ncbi:MAG: hypothetical protein H0W62_00670 [Chitinophagales bacterium]|nr:hypothetical protein [Chitinophagales bacterium]
MLPAVNVILSFIFLISVKIDASFITTDYLQNAYLISGNSSLVKMDSAGNILFTYNQNLYGSLRSVDATDPLKIILTYPDYGTIVMVDNTLSELSVMRLRQIGILNFNVACVASRDNSVWVFDEQDYKLKKIDRNNAISLESSDMFSLIGKAVHPSYMRERDQYVYITDPDIGILIFDNYGIYKETLPFKNITKFQVRNDQVLFRVQNALHTYQVTTIMEQKITLPDSIDIMDISIERNRLYLLKKDELKLFKF